MDAVVEKKLVHGVDARLLQEALRRACVAWRDGTADPDALMNAILEAAREGARDMHSLVGAARQLEGRSRAA